MMHMSSDTGEKEWPTFCRSEETFIFPIIQANEIYGMQMFFDFFFCKCINVSILIITCYAWLFFFF